MSAHEDAARVGCASRLATSGPRLAYLAHLARFACRGALHAVPDTVDLDGGAE